MRRAQVLVVALVFTPVAALAQTAPPDTGPTGRVSVGASVSTLGIGPEAGFRPTDNLGLRLGANFFDFGFNKTIDSVPYHFDTHLRSGGAVIDFYPFETGLRLSAGLRINGNDADTHSTPTSDVTIGGTTYTPALVGTLSGTVKFNHVAPYVGLGYSSALFDTGFELALEAGVLYQGRANVSLSASGPVAADPAFQANLATEEHNVANHLRLLEWYPVVALTLGYRF